VRLPKVVIEEAGLVEDVELQVRGGAVVIRSRHRPRAGWAEAARQVHAAREGRSIDEPIPTRFDDEEWRWR